MYTVPFSSSSLTSAALIVGNITTNLLGAPGVGQRYRVIGAHIWLVRTSTGIVDVIIRGVPGAQNIFRAAGLSVAGTPGAVIVFPFPGIQLDDNVGIEMQSSSTAATGAVIGSLYYTIDSVS